MHVVATKLFFKDFFCGHPVLHIYSNSRYKIRILCAVCNFLQKGAVKILVFFCALIRVGGLGRGAGNRMRLEGLQCDAIRWEQFEI